MRTVNQFSFYSNINAKIDSRPSTFTLLFSSSCSSSNRALLISAVPSSMSELLNVSVNWNCSRPKRDSILPYKSKMLQMQKRRRREGKKLVKSDPSTGTILMFPNILLNAQSFILIISRKLKQRGAATREKLMDAKSKLAASVWPSPYSPNSPLIFKRKSP